MTEKQLEQALESSRNLFITGPAGTGKSYLLNQYLASHENTLVCAPTGIAALNVGGDTMHRLFHIPVPSYEPPSFAKNNKKAVPNSVIKTLASADTVIIDEISMCRADVFRYAVKVLRKAEKVKGGKIRVIVSGDFSQLPPVVKTGDEKLLKKFGFDVSGFPFTTQEWKSLNFRVLELTDIKRQDNLEFIENLNRIRVGDYSTLDYFDRFIGDMCGFEDAICVCGTNVEADRMNREYLDSLPGPPMAYLARKEGWATANMVDDVIILKVGARVIFTANDTQKNRYRNGSFGVITAMGQDGVGVLIGNKEYQVGYQTWPVCSYGMSGGRLTKKEIGSVSQLPLKLAKAITIHRSQGQTFDKTVIQPDVFAPGQLYVALSRVRTPEGLRLLRGIIRDDLILDKTVQKFYKAGYTWDVKASAKKAEPKKSAKPKAKTTTTKTSVKKDTGKKPPIVKRQPAKTAKAVSTAKTVKKPVLKKTSKKETKTCKKG